MSLHRGNAAFNKIISEAELHDVLNHILDELVTFNNYMALMNNTEDPPKREDTYDTNQLS